MILNTLLFIGGLGAGEIFMILLIVLVFFGANKIPELAKGLGKGIREFKEASKEVESNIQKEIQKDNN